MGNMHIVDIPVIVAAPRADVPHARNGHPGSEG